MTEEKKDGGPAFGTPNPSDWKFGCYGLSKREWYAGMALQGVLACGKAPMGHLKEDGMIDENYFVIESFKYADLMIREGEK